MGLFTAVEKTTASLNTKKFYTEFGQLLMDGEIIDAGFVVMRDTFLFTNKRLIIVEVQGISGRQLEYLSIPYGKIKKFSVQTGGSFDLNAELKVWVGNDSIPLEKHFNQEQNIYEVHKVLAAHVLK